MRHFSSIIVAYSLVLSLTLVTAACGDDDVTPPDTDAGADAGDPGPRDAGTDAGRDAGGRPDAGPSCTTGCAIEQVVAGFEHSCARRMNGTVLCWGRNYDGELGDDNMRHTDCNMAIGGEYLDCAPNPVMVVMLTDARDISSHGGRTTCARRMGGEVVCWGLEEVLRAGMTELTKRFEPVARAEFMGADTVGPGDSHSCAITGGAIECLGDNRSGEAGDGTFTRRADAVAVAMPMAADQVEAATAANTTCARAGGEVYCWGSNSSRQLGDGAMTMHTTCMSGTTRFDCSNVAVQVTGITNATDIAVGGQHACARLMTGTVQCWGANYFGQLGTGDTMDRAVPTDVVGLTDAVDVVAGASHTCARRMGGTVQCWGANRRGELGDGMMDGHATCTVAATSQDCSSMPVTVMGLAGATQIAAGFQHTCAVTSAAEVFCWGFNESKQIGNGMVVDAFAPVRVPGI